MAAYNFPNSPSIGDIYPEPAIAGRTQYKWNGLVWEIIPSYVQTGNQQAYNLYTWPDNIGVDGTQLTVTSTGELSWTNSATTTFALVSLNEPFDGTRTSFTLVNPGTTVPFIPSPPSNILVFLGGVPQIPNASYTITGSEIEFTEAPLEGSTFYAISSKVL